MVGVKGYEESWLEKNPIIEKLRVPILEANVLFTVQYLYSSIALQIAVPCSPPSFVDHKRWLRVKTNMTLNSDLKKKLLPNSVDRNCF